MDVPGPHIRQRRTLALRTLVRYDVDANMRTLATQVRLRRLIRVHGEYTERLAAAPSDGELARLARARLVQLADDVRRAWLADLAAAEPAPEQSLLDRHVARG